LLGQLSSRADEFLTFSLDHIKERFCHHQKNFADDFNQKRVAKDGKS
jgi:hypothetical protein